METYTIEPQWARKTLAKGDVAIFAVVLLYGMYQSLALSADKLDVFDEADQPDQLCGAADRACCGADALQLTVKGRL